MNLGGRGCSELRSRHCTAVWATERLCKKKRKNEREKKGEVGGRREREREREKKNRSSMVAQACNPRTLGSQGRWITWSQEFETSLAITVESHLY